MDLLMSLKSVQKRSMIISGGSVQEPDVFQMESSKEIVPLQLLSEDDMAVVFGPEPDLSDKNPVQVLDGPETQPVDEIAPTHWAFLSAEPNSYDKNPAQEPAGLKTQPIEEMTPAQWPSEHDTEDEAYL